LGADALSHGYDLQAGGEQGCRKPNGQTASPSPVRENGSGLHLNPLSNDRLLHGDQFVGQELTA
jgi:hypothetical protein